MEAWKNPGEDSRGKERGGRKKATSLINPTCHGVSRLPRVQPRA